MKKRGALPDYLIWLIIGTIVLVIGVVVTILLTERGQSALDFVKNLARFGR